MLTDYHVHLRPDDVEATAERYFTAANADRYRTVASSPAGAAPGELDAENKILALAVLV